MIRVGRLLVGVVFNNESVKISNKAFDWQNKRINKRYANYMKAAWIENYSQ